MSRADKLLKTIGRSLMTDRLLLCLLLLVVIGIVVIVVLKVIGVNFKGQSVGSGTLIIDCSLAWAQNLKECQIAQGMNP